MRQAVHHDLKSNTTFKDSGDCREYVGLGKYVELDNSM